MMGGAAAQRTKPRNPFNLAFADWSQQEDNSFLATYFIGLSVSCYLELPYGSSSHLQN